jgi:hypothetical protein
MDEVEVDLPRSAEPGSSRPSAFVASFLLRVATIFLVAVGSAQSAPISRDESLTLLAAIGGSSQSAAHDAIDRIVDAEDRRFTAVFIELIRASQIGIADPSVAGRASEVLKELSGQSFGTDWAGWVRWYAGTDLEPPAGFVGFKGRLLGRIDPAFETLLRDEHPSRIRAEEIVWGGVAYEGIPALDRPRVIPAAKGTYLEPDEPVFGIRIGEEARAYPLRILDWHEMANDELGGVQFSLAYCTLCGSGIAYDTRVAGRSPLDFGSSGFLMRSNKLMVDRQTRTLWNQFTGRPVLGPLAAEEIRLAVLPSVVTRWQDWLARYPKTTVLSLDTGHERPYHPGAAYAGYFASPHTMFPVRRTRDELPDKARIFGLERDGVARAYPLEALHARRVVNDRFRDDPIVLVVSGPRLFVDGRSVRSGPARYDAGAAVRAYRRGSYEFHAGEAPDALTDETGRPWSVHEDALVGPDAQRLERVPGVLAYWFGWQSYHPRTELYASESASNGLVEGGAR